MTRLTLWRQRVQREHPHLKHARIALNVMRDSAGGGEHPRRRPRSPISEAERSTACRSSAAMGFVAQYGEGICMCTRWPHTINHALIVLCACRHNRGMCVFAALFSFSLLAHTHTHKTYIYFSASPRIDLSI